MTEAHGLTSPQVKSTETKGDYERASSEHNVDRQGLDN